MTVLDVYKRSKFVCFLMQMVMETKSLQYFKYKNPQSFI